MIILFSDMNECVVVYHLTGIEMPHCKCYIVTSTMEDTL